MSVVINGAKTKCDPPCWYGHVVEADGFIVLLMVEFTVGIPGRYQDRSKVAQLVQGLGFFRQELLVGNRQRIRREQDWFDSGRRSQGPLDWHKWKLLVWVPCDDDIRSPLR